MSNHQKKSARKNVREKNDLKTRCLNECWMLYELNNAKLCHLDLLEEFGQHGVGCSAVVEQLLHGLEREELLDVDAIVQQQLHEVHSVLL